MAAFTKTRRFGSQWRPWTLCAAILFALAAISPGGASRAATHAPDVASVHCPTSSSGAPEKHPCEGAHCCPLCQSEKEALGPFIAAAPTTVVYAPPRRAIGRAALASPAPVRDYARYRFIAAPRAPPCFS